MKDTDRCRKQKIDKEGNYLDAFCIWRKGHKGKKHLYRSGEWWSLR